MPRKGKTALDIELMTTRAAAEEWAEKNGVPETDLIRPVPPTAKLSDVREAFRMWFASTTPEDLPQWTRRHCPGTLTAVTVPYHLTRYTYSPLTAQTACVTPTAAHEHTGDSPAWHYSSEQ